MRRSSRTRSSSNTRSACSNRRRSNEDWYSALSMPNRSKRSPPMDSQPIERVRLIGGDGIRDIVGGPVGPGSLQERPTASSPSEAFPRATAFGISSRPIERPKSGAFPTDYSRQAPPVLSVRIRGDDTAMSPQATRWRS